MWGPGRDISCRGVGGIIILPRVKLSTFPYARCCCAEYEEEQLVMMVMGVISIGWLHLREAAKKNVFFGKSSPNVGG